MSIIKFFLCSLAQKKGVERNLLIKKFIKNIVYSKDEIRLNLYYSKHFDVSQNASLSRSTAFKTVQNKKGDFRIHSEIPQFETKRNTPQLKSSQTIPVIIPNIIHKSRKRNFSK